MPEPADGPARAALLTDTVPASVSRVLLVGGGAELVEAVDEAVRERWPATELVQVARFDAPAATVFQQDFQAICFRLEAPYGRALSALEHLRSVARSQPIVVLGPQRDVAFVDLVLRSGADLWIVDDPLDPRDLEEALAPVLTPGIVASSSQGPGSRARLLALDHDSITDSGEPPPRDADEHAPAVEPHGVAAPDAEQPSDGSVAEHEAGGPTEDFVATGAGVEVPLCSTAQHTSRASEAQASPAPDLADAASADSAATLDLRLARARRLALIPIGANGLPDAGGIVRARSLDIGAGVLRLVLEGWTPCVGGSAVVAAELEEAQNEFAWVQHDLAASATDGRFVARIHGTIEDLLGPERLEPVLDPATMRYRYGHAEAWIAAWCELGVLVPEVVDRVIVCPRCDAVPTLRLGCRRCSSGRLHRERLIHHFACANVARESAYDDPRGVACPKCRAHGLVVNADFDYLSGPWECRDCGFQCGERDPVCHCPVCSERFFVTAANELDLVSYHAARMEPLALLAAP